MKGAGASEDPLLFLQKRNKEFPESNCSSETSYCRLKQILFATLLWLLNQRSVPNVRVEQDVL